MTLPGLLAWGPTVLGGGYQAVAALSPPYNDEFTSDIAGWTASEPASGACEHDLGNGELIIRNGVCVYDGLQAGKGGQANSRAQWNSVLIGQTNDGLYVGPALRHKGSDMGEFEYFYMARYDSTSHIAVIRVCGGGTGGGENDCADVRSGMNLSGGTVGTGSSLRLMVDGEGASTEFAIWGSSTPPADPCDPTSWGNANFCVSDTGAISLLSAYCPCPGANCVSWTDPASTRGYPAAGQLYSVVASGTGANRSFTRVCGGNIP